MKNYLVTFTLLVSFGANSAPVQTNTAVEFRTALGNISITLFDDLAPNTVANFLSYVSDDGYTESIVHRSVPGFVIQGGGYNTSLQLSPTNPPIAIESTSVTGLSNVRGTISMARASAPNSARNQWFINIADNQLFLDATQSNPGYAVFGQVTGSGMTIVDAIAALPYFSFIPGQPGGTEGLPLRNYSLADYQAGVQPTINNFVVVNSVAVVPEPSSLLLVALGLIGVTASIRRGIAPDMSLAALRLRGDSSK